MARAAIARAVTRASPEPASLEDVMKVIQPDMDAARSHAASGPAAHAPHDRTPRLGSAMRHLAWRAAGVAVIASAAGVSLLHRHVLEKDIKGPATASEILLSLLGFLLASLGVLLLLQGSKLHEGWVRDCRRVRADPTDDPTAAAPDGGRTARDTIAADYCMAPPGGRAAIAMFLADRALQTAARQPKEPAVPPDNSITGHSS